MRLIFVSTAILAGLVSAQSIEPHFTTGGELMRPQDYREWIYLSSGLGMTYSENASNAEPRFDNVFVNPDAYRSFLKTGAWPDRTIFILEIRDAIAKGSINQGGHYQGGISGVEAEVKDKRAPDGWGYYAFGASGTTAKPLPNSARCLECHSKNGAVENTFVQFYPALLEIARGKGVLKASYMQQANAH